LLHVALGGDLPPRDPRPREAKKELRCVRLGAARHPSLTIVVRKFIVGDSQAAAIAGAAASGPDYDFRKPLTTLSGCKHAP